MNKSIKTNVTLGDYAREAAENGYLIAVYLNHKRISFDLRRELHMCKFEAPDTAFYAPPNGKYGEKRFGKGKTFSFILHKRYGVPSTLNVRKRGHLLFDAGKRRMRRKGDKTT